MATDGGKFVDAEGTPADAVVDLPPDAQAAWVLQAVPAALVQRPGDPTSHEYYGVTTTGELSRRPGPGAPATLARELGTPTQSKATGTPAVASWAPGRVDVFVRGADKVIHQTWLKDGVWRDWGTLGDMQMTSDPAVATWGADRLDLFARGPGNELRHIWYEVGWSIRGWEDLGGSLASHPAVVASRPQRLDVFARGQAGDVLHLYFDTAWSTAGWVSLGGAANLGISATTRRASIADVYAADSGGRLKLMRVWLSGRTEWLETPISVKGEFRAVALGPRQVSILELGPGGELSARTLQYPDDRSPGPTP